MRPKDLIEIVCPDFPTDRKVIETPTWSLYFRINYNQRILYIPHEKALLANHILIDETLARIKVFANMELVAPDWSKLSYDTDGNDVFKAIDLLQSLPTSGFIASDIESKNTEYRTNGMLSVSFCHDPNRSILITTFKDKVLDELQKVYNNVDRKFIWHNGKFDITRMEYLTGVQARVDEDTMLLHYVGINEKKGIQSLEKLAGVYLDAPDWEAELKEYKKKVCSQMKIRQEDFTYDMFPKDILYRYAALDPVMTLRLREELSKHARPESDFIYRKLIEASNTYGRVELNGVKLDLDYLEDLEYDLEKQLKEATNVFDTQVNLYWDASQYKKDTGAKSLPARFNIKSPQQLKWLLSEVVGRPIHNTRAETIEELVEDVGNEFPVLAALGNVRKINKYLDTYTDGLRSFLCEDHRIRCTYKLNGTETGRLSSADPNMQNIPRDSMIKNLFVASPGTKLLQFDYSQAELRVLAYLSGDEFLSSIYIEGKDLHDSVASKIYGPNFDKEDRVKAKAVNFGIVYGRGPGNLAKVLKIPFNEARKLIDDWFKHSPRAKIYVDKQKHQAVKGPALTTPFGRQRHFVITNENYNNIQREGANFQIQSVASDLTLLSLLEMHKWIYGKNLQDDVKIIITVHDSIILEVADDSELINLIALECSDIMVKVPQMYLPGLSIPFKADVEIGDKWGELHAYSPGEQ